MPLYFYWRTIS